jgi:hypothetical protein
VTTVARFFALPGRARALLVAAAAAQLGARLSLRLCGLRFTVRIARGLGSMSPAVPDLLMLRWALAASAPRVGGTCLTQALSACALGGSASRRPRLVIGARPRTGVPEFHAWTEIAGVTLPGTPGASFTDLTSWT